MSFSDNGIPTMEGAPSNTGEWISLFSTRATSVPGGGPAYIVNRDGSKLTGAIGFSATNYGGEVHISRPPFLGLRGQKVIITPIEMTYDPPRAQR
jgi:hypothetical protein